MVDVNTNNIKTLCDAKPKHAVRSLCQDPEGNVIVARKNGIIERLNLDTESFTVVHEESKKELVKACYSRDKLCVLYKPGSIFIDDLEWKVPGNNANSITAQDNRLAITSTNTNLQILDLNTQQVIWRAKKESNTTPVHDNVCCFFQPHLIAVGTAFNEVKLYDINRAKKPIFSIQLNPKEHSYHLPLTTISSSPNASYIFAGDSIGQIYRLTPELKLYGKLRERSVGAIRDLTVTSEEEVVSVSLDRYLRIYNAETARMEKSLLLWHKLSSLLVIS